MVKSVIQLLLLSLLIALLLRGSSRWQKWFRAGALATAIVTLLFMTPNVLHRAINYWERFPLSNENCSKPLDTIVVLPGGTRFGTTPATDNWGQLTQSSLQRLLKGAEIAVDQSVRRLAIPGTQVEARLMRQLAQERGVPAANIETDGGSHNTWLASVWVARSAKDWGNMALVTSALHMRRALWSFQQQGIEVCPIAVDPEGVDPKPWWLLPKSSDTRKADLLMHELLGMIWYRFRHRED